MRRATIRRTSAAMWSWMWIWVAAAVLIATDPIVAQEPTPEPRRFVRVPAPDRIQIRRYNQTEGAMPTRKDRVVVHYHGTLKDGSVFDSTRDTGRPATFKLDQVIPCWTEALTRLRVGEKAQLVCPPDTAYGAAGSPPQIPAKARLTFEVEILGIQ